VAMQIAAMNPLCVTREEVEKATIEKEIESIKKYPAKKVSRNKFLKKLLTEN